MPRESFARTMVVATCLCVVCSVLVSSATVLLRPKQEANQKRQMQKDILQVTGRYDATVPLADLFQQVETRLVDLAAGDYVDPATIDPAKFDPKAAAKDPALSVAIDRADDLAGITRREKYAPVYLVKGPAGALDQVVLPVRGKGLWSTMYGFLSLESNLQTVHGITFYEHAETPGLGGEIDNPRWQAKWQGKVLFDDQGAPRIEAARGDIDLSQPDAVHQIDALAGATITTRGVTDMIRYWLGRHGFGPFLDKQKGKVR
ncbi:MAG: Na(+)-translocating NADH-quinone reductase subunit C [Planctomycetes bacterium RBG_16_64_10]|nr:MAG: Na(+)-translocating NADH-quinone reductase subunit C [Planctomycetes bacterium RBG_16_64_10]